MEEVLTFEDVKALFREKDRGEMIWAFDLWNADDVRGSGPAILDRIENGDMPCDDRWPEEKVELLRRWIAEGGPE